MSSAPAISSSAPPALSKIDELEARMRANGAPVTIEPIHHFAKGIYAREIRIPAGTLLTGKIHKTQHLNVISAGYISVYCEGEPVRHVRAPFTFVAEPGTRRVGYAHEDTVWTTIHASEETDLVKLEAALILPNPAPVTIQQEDSPCLGSQ
jgi:hypothetical protein